MSNFQVHQSTPDAAVTFYPFTTEDTIPFATGDLPLSQSLQVTKTPGTDDIISIRTSKPKGGVGTFNIILSSEQNTRPGSFSQGSPLPHQSSPLTPSGQGSVGLESLISPESPPHSGDLPGYPPVPARRDSDPGVRSNVTDSTATIGLGLGIPSALLAAGGQKGPGIPNSLLSGGCQNKMAVRVRLMTG